MTLLLRKIRKSKWYRTGTNALPWLTSKDIQADALGDLGTKENKLSLYRVNLDESNLNRVISALAANCQEIANFDYALFDESIINNIGIKIENTKGDTPDILVNDQHIDIVELSARKLLSLAEAIISSGKIDRILHKKVEELLVDNFKKGNLIEEKLKLKQESRQKIKDKANQ